MNADLSVKAYSLSWANFATGTCFYDETFHYYATSRNILSEKQVPVYLARTGMAQFRLKVEHYKTIFFTFSIFYSFQASWIMYKRSNITMYMTKY